MEIELNKWYPETEVWQYIKPGCVISVRVRAGNLVRKSKITVDSIEPLSNGTEIWVRDTDNDHTLLSKYYFDEEILFHKLVSERNNSTTTTQVEMPDKTKPLTRADLETGKAYSDKDVSELIRVGDVVCIGGDWEFEVYDVYNAGFGDFPIRIELEGGFYDDLRGEYTTSYFNKIVIFKSFAWELGIAPAGSTKIFNPFEYSHSTSGELGESLAKNVLNMTTTTYAPSAKIVPMASNIPHFMEMGLLKKPKKKHMNTLMNKLKQLAEKEPQKTFRKVGITYESGNLTEEGKEVFMNWLFEKHADDFKTEVADVLLEELEKDSD
jgi:hypothetical protein